MDSKSEMLPLIIESVKYEFNFIRVNNNDEQNQCKKICVNISTRIKMWV